MSGINDWAFIQKKLWREKKTNLIQLIQQLAAVSNDAQHFLQTRYVDTKTINKKIAPYRKVIKKQFAFSDWNNTVTWNFPGIQKALNDYAISSLNDEKGLAELFVFALEAAVSFADLLNLEANDFDHDLGELAEQCVNHFHANPNLVTKCKTRLEKVESQANNLGFYSVTDHFINLTELNR